MIDIIIPVLGRPQNAAPLVRNIRDATTVEHRIIFMCSDGDDDQIRACLDSGADITRVAAFAAGPGDYARKINLGEWTTGDMVMVDENRVPDSIVPGSEWIFMGADDLRFGPGWDTHAIRAAGTRFNVVGTNDLANAQVKRGEFGTHCLIRRRYITEQGGTADNQPGAVLWEGYDHNFVDRELCHVAQHRGVFVFARHSHVRHLHPLWKTAPHDATYRKALAHFRDDQRLFLSRAHLWGFVGLSEPERRMAA